MAARDFHALERIGHDEGGALLDVHFTALHGKVSVLGDLSGGGFSVGFVRRDGGANREIAPLLDRERAGGQFRLRCVDDVLRTFNRHGGAVKTDRVGGERVLFDLDRIVTVVFSRVIFAGLHETLVAREVAAVLEGEFTALQFHAGIGFGILRPGGADPGAAALRKFEFAVRHFKGLVGADGGRRAAVFFVGPFLRARRGNIAGDLEIVHLQIAGRFDRNLAALLDGKNGGLFTVHLGRVAVDRTLHDERTAFGNDGAVNLDGLTRLDGFGSRNGLVRPEGRVDDGGLFLGGRDDRFGVRSHGRRHRGGSRNGDDRLRALGLDRGRDLVHHHQRPAGFVENNFERSVHL